MLFNLLAIVALAATVFSKSPKPECTRELLQETTDAYIFTQQAGYHQGWHNIAYNLTYLENNVTAQFLFGILSKPQVVTANRSIFDTVQCSTFTQLIITTEQHPYVIGTQLWLSEQPNQDGLVVHKIDTLITDAGDWAFNATGYLYWDSIEKWDPIPAQKRDTREVLKAAADAYCDRCNDVTVKVPFGVPCARLEGGAYTGRGNLSANTCDIGGLPEHIKLSNRRYVIDEAMGTVDVFLGFQGLERTKPNASAPDSHLFRIEEGKIKYIHTVSVCDTPHCGYNGTSPPNNTISRKLF